MTFNAKPYLFKPTNLKSWRQAYNKSFIAQEYVTPIEEDYRKTLRHKNTIESDKVKELYNKKNVKVFFEKHGLTVPKLYYYTNSQRDITTYLREEYVAKPAHMSESVGIFINERNFKKVNKSLNESVQKEPRATEPKMMKQAEKGILVEEFIDYDYEFKVFVLYGCPIVGDLRDGPKEWHRVDMIDIENQYFDWQKEYDACKRIAKELKIDFFRIDFFYTKKNKTFYAGEMAFRPSTLLGQKIEDYVMQKWHSAR